MKIFVLNESQKQKKSELILKNIEDYKEKIAGINSNSEFIFSKFFQAVKFCERAILVNKLDSKIKLKTNLIEINSDGLENSGKFPKEITISINGKNYTFKTKLSPKVIADVILDKIIENPDSLDDKISTKQSLRDSLSLCINGYFSDLNSIIDSLKNITKLQTKYEEQVKKEEEAEKKEEEKSQAFKNSLPKILIELMDNLVKNMDTYDFKVKKFLLKKFEELGKDEFASQYGKSGYNLALINYSDEYIHKVNMTDAEILVKQLISKTKSVTGDIVKLEGIDIAPGNKGVSLNGRVIGKKGQCNVESIIAGGYNIQKEHIRVILKNKKKF